MTFTVNDFHDLIELIYTHPEWRAEMRRVVLDEELLDLPTAVRDMVQAQAAADARAEKRFARVEAALEKLAQAQARTEARVEELTQAQARTEARVEELAQAQARTEARLERLESAVEELVKAQASTERKLADLTLVVGTLQATLHIVGERVNQMRGDWLAIRYADRAYGYFGRILRRVRVFYPSTQLDAKVEERLEQHLTSDEIDQIFALDILAFGRLRQPPTPDDAEVWLAVEVSGVIDRNDVERAHERASLVRKAGYRAIPVVAGEGLTEGATKLLGDLPVVMILDGRSEGWERALAAI